MAFSMSSFRPVAFDRSGKRETIHDWGKVRKPRSRANEKNSFVPFAPFSLVDIPLSEILKSSPRGLSSLRSGSSVPGRDPGLNETVLEALKEIVPTSQDQADPMKLKASLVEIDKSSSAAMGSVTKSSENPGDSELTRDSRPDSGEVCPKETESTCDSVGVGILLQKPMSHERFLAQICGTGGLSPMVSAEPEPEFVKGQRSEMPAAEKRCTLRAEEEGKLQPNEEKQEELFPYSPPPVSCTTRTLPSADVLSQEESSAFSGLMALSQGGARTAATETDDKSEVFEGADSVDAGSNDNPENAASAAKRESDENSIERLCGLRRFYGWGSHSARRRRLERTSSTPLRNSDESRPVKRANRSSYVVVGYHRAKRVKQYLPHSSDVAVARGRSSSPRTLSSRRGVWRRTMSTPVDSFGDR